MIGFDIGIVDIVGYAVSNRVMLNDLVFVVVHRRMKHSRFVD